MVINVYFNNFLGFEIEFEINKEGKINDYNKEVLY